MFDLNRERIYIGDKKKIQESREGIYGQPENEEYLDNLDNTLISIVNPEVNESSYNELYMDLHKSVMDEMFDQTSHMQGDLGSFLGGALTTSLSETLLDNNVRSVLEDSIRSNLFNQTGVQPTDAQVSGALSTITGNLQSKLGENAAQYIGQNVYSLSGKLLGCITDKLYTNSALDGVSPAVGMFATGMMSSTSEFLQSEIRSLITTGQLDANAGSKLAEAFSSNLDSFKNQALNGLTYQVNSQLGNALDRINDKIGNVFCGARVELTPDGLSITPPSLQLQNLEVNGIPVGKYASALMHLATPKSNQAIDKVQSKVTGNIKEKTSEAQAKAENGWKNVPDTNTPKENTNKDVANKNNKAHNIQNRKESNTVSDSSKENKNEKPLPPIETYDNSKPTRATINKDPRRDNCQELVLWEGKDKYVLLRDGIGNYVLLDEDKQCVRIQHKCGSYIQLSSNGNIEIEAAANVRLNCFGAKYVKQF